MRQTEAIKLCNHLAEINNIGISTYLYFQTVKNLLVMLLIMTLAYSIYALATNLIASGVINSNSTLSSTIKSGVSYIALSVGSKQLNPTDDNKKYYFIQCWIGVGLLVLWMLVFFFLKYSEAAQEAKVE